MGTSANSYGYHHRIDSHSNRQTGLNDFGERENVKNQITKFNCDEFKLNWLLAKNWWLAEWKKHWTELILTSTLLIKFENGSLDKKGIKNFRSTSRFVKLCVRFYPTSLCVFFLLAIYFLSVILSWCPLFVCMFVGLFVSFSFSLFLSFIVSFILSSFLPFFLSLSLSVFLSFFLSFILSFIFSLFISFFPLPPSFPSPCPQAATSAVGWQVDDHHSSNTMGLNSSQRISQIPWAQIPWGSTHPKECPKYQRSKIKSVLECFSNKLDSKTCHLNCCQGNEIW